jgi:hypothetical protein
MIRAAPASESQPDSHLHDARIAVRGRNHAKARTTERCRRISELMWFSELKASRRTTSRTSIPIRPDRGLLGETQVEIEKARADRHIATRVAGRIQRLHLERCRVEKLIAIYFRADSALRIAYAIRPQRSSVRRKKLVVLIVRRIHARRGQRSAEPAAVAKRQIIDVREEFAAASAPAGLVPD